MNICSDKHDEIVYDGRECPLCITLGALDAEEEENGTLREQLDLLDS